MEVQSMRVWLHVGVLVVMVGAGSRVVTAQTVERGWWDWATPFVSSGQTGRVAIPRPRDDGGDDRTRDRLPSDTRDDDGQISPERPEGRTSRGRGGLPISGGPGRGRGRGDAGTPAFCRTGEGHPVFGWQWCVDRGFARRGDRYRPVWQREGWTDIIPPWPTRQREGRVDAGTLGAILGDIVFGRLRARADQLDADGPLEARWIRPQPDALVLQVRAGDLPIAELSDTTGDGSAEVVMVNRPTR
jgi:hypothetical protein